MTFDMFASERPEALSPGSEDIVAAVEWRCPSFSWSPVADASYELVVTPLDAQSLESIASAPQLKYRLPAGVTSWAPSGSDCLERGQTYTWSVSAIGRNGSLERSDEKFFLVPVAPSPAEIGAALEVLHAAGALPSIPQEAPQSTARPAVQGLLTNPQGGMSGPAIFGETTSTDPGSAGVVGLASGASGSTHGVIGRAQSPNGDGVLAAHLDPAGGTDLRLDGFVQMEADALLSQSGLDRPSGTPQTFSIGNSGGGGMTLAIAGTVDADEFTGSGSGLTNVPVANHSHAGEDITSGTVAEPRIEDTLARDGEVFGLVLASDGAGSTLDADTLDGLDSADLTSATRRYYLTAPGFTGLQATGACATGFHMASLWEILDVSNLRYDAALGQDPEDGGDGPPAGFSGWVRTGSIHGNTTVGAANCQGWTSDNPAVNGTIVRLITAWLSTISVFPVSPWDGQVFACDTGLAVWCVED